MCHARTRLYLLLFAFVLCSRSRSTRAGFLEDNYPAEVIEDARLNTLQLLRKYKYPAETHVVLTEDQYILNMHRIPRAGAKPVLLVHGVMDTSATWLIMGPQSAPGYYFYDEGYDVWLGNVRGNRYSRNHTTLNPDTDKTYWRFSWHEIGMFDLPAMIDAVLNATGYQQLTYFGHSQGTTSFFVMASMRPEYNAKLHIMHALAPVSFMANIKTPVLGMMKNFLRLYREPYSEFLPHAPLMVDVCFSSQIAVDTCAHYFYEIAGKDLKQMNMTKFPIMMGHYPSGCSLKQIRHFLQLVQSNRFAQYDYGARENTKRYGQTTPPDYPLQNITAPIGLYYARNDYLSSVVDVKRLAKRLPRVVEDSLYPYKKWCHMSMLWGIESRQLAHKRMLELTRQYDGGTVPKPSTSTNSPPTEVATESTSMESTSSESTTMESSSMESTTVAASTATDSVVDAAGQDATDAGDAVDDEVDSEEAGTGFR